MFMKLKVTKEIETELTNLNRLLREAAKSTPNVESKNQKITYEVN